MSCIPDSVGCWSFWERLIARGDIISTYFKETSGKKEGSVYETVAGSSLDVGYLLNDVVLALSILFYKALSAPPCSSNTQMLCPARKITCF